MSANHRTGRHRGTRQRPEMLFITNLPSFYKIRLFNRIAEKRTILVAYLSNVSAIRTPDFTEEQETYDAVAMNNSRLETRGVLRGCVGIVRLLRRTNAGRLVLGGWDAPEYWLAAFLSPVRKNSMILESSLAESTTRGLKAFAKRAFLRRVNTVFAAGKSHARLARELGFRRRIRVTGGVGLAYLPPDAGPLREGHICRVFLYAGRLAPEKNPELAVTAFASRQELTLIMAGDGPLRDKLEDMASDNVTILGHVPAREMFQLYRSCDALILPSFSEPWGLVVEEALHFGMPVLVSRAAGCSSDLVIDDQNGYTIDPQSRASLERAIDCLKDEKTYARLCGNIARQDMLERQKQQIAAFVEPSPARERYCQS